MQVVFTMNEDYNQKQKYISTASYIVATFVVLISHTIICVTELFETGCQIKLGDTIIQAKARTQTVVSIRLAQIGMHAVHCNGKRMDMYLYHYK